MGQTAKQVQVEELSILKISIADDKITADSMELLFAKECFARIYRK